MTTRFASTSIHATRRMLSQIAMCWLLAAGAAISSTGNAAEAPPVVLTGIQATYSIASALVAGTPIQVRNIPADGRELASQKDYIERRKEALGPTFAGATAVITLTTALAQDPLYRFARQANVRIVDIEAALPWALDVPGVALASTPRTDVSWARDADAPAAGTAPYFWLSLSNTIRMADIIAGDLSALFPASAPAIARNLEALKRSMLALRGQYQQRLIDGGADVVFALTGDGVYLTNDLGLLVDGYFIKQDLRWTPADLANLTKHLREHQIKVVIHRWLPSEAIQQAVRSAGARLVVLDMADPGVATDGALAADGLQRILHSNLDALVAGTTAK